MLSPADRELVGRDPRIPGLALTLDADALVAVLRDALPAVDLRAARITYLRYKPGMSCLAACRLQIADEQVDAYVHAFGPAADDKLGGACEKSSTGGALGPGRLVLTQHSLVVAVLPNDEGIKGLKHLMLAQRRLKLLQNLLPKRTDLHDTQLERLAYKPKRRYVGAVLTSAGPALVARAYAPSGRVSAAPRGIGFGQGSMLAVAACVAIEERRGIQVFEWLPGTVLTELTGSVLEREGWFQHVGHALAELHAGPQDAPLLAHIASGAELPSAAQTIATICPELAKQAADLARRVAHGMESAPAVPVRILHGDFHPGQTLIQGERVGVLDFDRAGIGDPAYDLGAFIAHLERDQATGRMDRDALDRLSAAFIDGYAAVGVVPTRASVRLHTAAALLRLAPEQFRYRDPDWSRTTAVLLDRCAELAAGDARPTTRTPKRFRARVDDPYGVDCDPAMPFLKFALDPDTACRELEAALGSVTGGASVRVRAIRVIRYKPTRRCLIEYDLDFMQSGRMVEALTVIGKVGARGPDTKMFACLQALWRDGFDAHSEDGVSIPEPVALVPALHMWLQRKVPGAVATSLLAGHDGVALTRRITDAIHKLHRFGPQAPREHTMADELGVLRGRLSAVARLYPTLEPRITGLLDSCEQIAATIGEPPWAGVHRDFYPDQVLVDGSRLYLVDLDLYAQGDPALDVGNFIAHLIEQGLRLHGDADALSVQIAAMQERFAMLSGDVARVHVYVALTLARHVSISTQIPERRWTTLALLELAERHVQALRPGCVSIASGNEIP